MRQKKQKHNALLTFFTRKKTLAKQQPRIVYTVLKKNRDGFFFQRFTLGKPKTFSRTTRQMVFFAEILLFFLFERS